MDSVQRIVRSLPTGGRAHPDLVSAQRQSAEAQTGRAMVSLAALPESRRSEFGRPAAVFLAQLIASEENLPQARARRRAEPREAIAAYEAAARGMTAAIS
jgi:aminoglycoside phosphotransferase (APT) family kinase protein